MTKKIPFLATPGGVHLFLSNKPVSVSSEDSRFSKVKSALTQGASEEEIEEILYEKERRLAAFEKDGVVCKDGIVYIDDEQVHGTLAARLLQQLEEGFDVAPLKAFVLNLRQNPSNTVLNNLYDFLEVGKNPLTEDGCFLAYKAVRKDFKDIHSGTFDNSVGQVVATRRNEVDEDRNRTCSYGLHVCSFGYLPSFAHADGHVVICKINPADVVAIPSDYNNTKMRVCRYEVIGEHEGYYTDKRKDVLGDGPRVLVDIDADPFVVSWPNFTAGFAQLSEAAKYAEELLENSSVEHVEITNTATGVSVFFQENENYIPDDDDGFDDEDHASIEDGRFEVTGYSERGGTENTSSFETFDDIEQAVRHALSLDDPYIEVRDTVTGEIKTISNS